MANLGGQGIFSLLLKRHASVIGLCNAIARLVEKELTKQGAKVIMTRTADVTKLKRPDYGIYWGNYGRSLPVIGIGFYDQPQITATTC